MRWKIATGSGLAILLAAVLVYSFAFADQEEEILLTEVPEHVLAAVQNARKDVTLKSAERIYKDSKMYYEIEGDIDDTELEFTVTPDGEIVSTDEED